MKKGWTYQSFLLLPLTFCLLTHGDACAGPPQQATPAVRAVEVNTGVVYRSPQTPGYTSWVCLWAGPGGSWMLNLDEVRKPDNPMKGATPQQFETFSAPVGYDKTRLIRENVTLRSTDLGNTWEVVGRSPGKFWHASHVFGAVTLDDGRMLRTIWGMYWIDSPYGPGDGLEESTDGGKTWHRYRALIQSNQFAVYPYRLRKLRDGTLVQFCYYALSYGPGNPLPTRASQRPEVAGSDALSAIFYSRDAGRSWIGPVPIYGDLAVSESDFIELPSGKLLFVVPETVKTWLPRRQYVHNTPGGLVPEAMMKVISGRRPECMTLTREGIIVGANRNRGFVWSDDEGRTWNSLEGVPNAGYQPDIVQLQDGRILCVWHQGGDDVPFVKDQFVGKTVFRLQVLRQSRQTRLELTRDFNPERNKMLNAFTARLTAEGAPVGEKSIEFRLLKRFTEAYSAGDWAKAKLELRVTDADGRARIHFPEMDGETNIHQSYIIRAHYLPQEGKDLLQAESVTTEFYAMTP